jgi:hypothetical protein
VADTTLTAGKLGTSKRFDLTAASSELFREIPLHEDRVLQSFSFDNAGRILYAVGLIQGGRRLRGESRTYSAAEREANGDLCVSRLDHSGEVTGRMYLRGFGHGVSIAAEGSWLWTETESVKVYDTRKKADIGWGSKLARFKFGNGLILTPESAGVTKVSPVPGADRTTVAIDPVNNRLAVRYRPEGAGFHYGLYDLAAFKAGLKSGTFTALATIAQPDGLGVFQGFTSLGRYLYTIDGTAYGDDNPDGNGGNTYITGIDWTTGTVYDRRLTRAGQTLRYREPEGLAVQLPKAGSATGARLVMGFASEKTENTEKSGKTASTTTKRASFYYKSAID